MTPWHVTEVHKNRSSVLNIAIVIEIQRTVPVFHFGSYLTLNTPSSSSMFASLMKYFRQCVTQMNRWNGTERSPIRTDHRLSPLLPSSLKYNVRLECSVLALIARRMHIRVPHTRPPPHRCWYRS
mmetsp:Transcript_35582/g.59401  ORF Transcript_35582/g.59401 Transcript_35582/m.59401 type:complete len:125 (-) Transcript_35582:320-694(-)